MIRNVCMILAVAAAGVVTAAERPNVVLIISDDYGFPDYGFMGSPHVLTPNLDRLASEGLTFTCGYVTTALCSPSLATTWRLGKTGRESAACAATAAR